MVLLHHFKSAFYRFLMRRSPYVAAQHGIAADRFAREIVGF
jgi:hypothetical protein